MEQEGRSGRRDSMCRGPGVGTPGPDVERSRGSVAGVRSQVLANRNAGHPVKDLNSKIFCCCSVTQSCLTLWDPKDCSAPGLPVPHHVPELAHTHVHRVGDAIQPSHPVAPFSSRLGSFPASGSFPVSLLFAPGGQSIGASASVLPMNIQD